MLGTGKVLQLHIFFDIKYAINQSISKLYDFLFAHREEMGLGGNWHGVIYELGIKGKWLHDKCELIFVS